MYADNENKFIAVLNKKIQHSTLLNALGHMAAGISANDAEHDQMQFLQYEDADGGPHPKISKYPFIILSAKNGNQIRTLRSQVREKNLPFTDFTDTMLGSSVQDQLQKTKECPEAELDYYGICVFGSAGELDPITKKFSLFRVSED